MARAFLLVCLFISLIFALDGSQVRPINTDAYEEPEQIVLKKEDLRDWLGGNVTERDERHAVGMCWQSEMVNCINHCKNSTFDQEIFQEICASYCQADITWMCTQLNLDYGGKEVFKFSGRWPFKRISIFCEPGSCLFCLLSVIGHSYFFWEYRTKTKNVERKSEGKNYPYSWLWNIMHPVWAFTFACAFLFHTVDIRLTEIMDYFSAMAAALYGLYAAVVRVFDIQKTINLWMLSTPFIGFYFFHIVRMGLIQFSYGYNMNATISIVASQSVLWIIWSLLNFQKARYVVWMVLGHICLFCFVALEVFDRPPLFGVFDPHAIWHFSIIIIFFLWNRFYIADTLNYICLSAPKAD